MNWPTALLFLAPLAAFLTDDPQPRPKGDREGVPEKAVAKPIPKGEADREDTVKGPVAPAKGKQLPAPKTGERDGSCAADLRLLRERFKDQEIRVTYTIG